MIDFNCRYYDYYQSLIASNFRGEKKDKRRLHYVSSESETDKENDEDKTVQTPARFKNSFKLKINDESSSSMERKKSVSCYTNQHK